MARTRAQWEEEIADALPAASTSNTAVWKLFRDLVVTLAVIFEPIIELFKADVSSYIDTKQPGSLHWYAQICKEFQNGDSLTVDNGIVRYAIVNPANLIIDQASVREKDDEVLTIKVCKKVAGVKQALSNAELTNFKNYIKARKLPGTKTDIVSLPADIVTYTIGGVYDPAYDATALQAALINAMIAFRDGFSFDGMLYYTELIEALISIPGMRHVDLTIDLDLSDGTAVSGFNSYKELPAGYFKYDASSIVSALTPAP